MARIFSESDLEMYKGLQKRVLKTIVENQPITISDISDIIYGKDNKMVLNKNNRISTAISQINTKMLVNGDPWFIDGSGGGRAGKIVWLELR